MVRYAQDRRFHGSPFDPRFQPGVDMPSRMVGVRVEPESGVSGLLTMIASTLSGGRIRNESGGAAFALMAGSKMNGSAIKAASILDVSNIAWASRVSGHRIKPESTISGAVLTSGNQLVLTKPCDHGEDACAAAACEPSVITTRGRTARASSRTSPE